VIIITVARKPLDGTVVATVLTWSAGGLNIDGCRVTGVPPSVPQWNRAAGNAPFDADGRNGRMSQPSQLGRWPSNLILSHAPGCGVDCEGGCPVSEMARQGDLVGSHSAGSQKAPQYGPSQHPDWLFNGFGANARIGDTGSAARFFKQVKR